MLRAQVRNRLVTGGKASGQPAFRCLFCCLIVVSDRYQPSRSELGCEG